MAYVYAGNGLIIKIKNLDSTANADSCQAIRFPVIQFQGSSVCGAAVKEAYLLMPRQDYFKLIKG